MAAKSYSEHLRAVAKADEEHRKMHTGVVPAAAGWYRIDVYDDGSNQTYTVPIVAWELLTYDGETVANPVCFESPADGNTHAVLAPDGRIFRPEDCSWENVESYVKSVAEERARKAANAK